MNQYTVEWPRAGKEEEVTTTFIGPEGTWVTTWDSDRRNTVISGSGSGSIEWGPHSYSRRATRGVRGEVEGIGFEVSQKSAWSFFSRSRALHVELGSDELVYVSNAFFSYWFELNGVVVVSHGRRTSVQSGLPNQVLTLIFLLIGSRITEEAEHPLS